MVMPQLLHSFQLVNVINVCMYVFFKIENGKTWKVIK